MLKHEEIQEYIKEQINSGTWKPKAKLPSLRDMSELFSTSIGTVLTAYSNVLPLKKSTLFIPSREADIMFLARIRCR